MTTIDWALSSLFRLRTVLRCRMGSGGRRRLRKATTSSFLRGLWYFFQVAGRGRGRQLGSCDADPVTEAKYSWNLHAGYFGRGRGEGGGISQYLASRMRSSIEIRSTSMSRCGRWLLR